MFLIRELAALALLTVACKGDETPDVAQRFHFPSSNLFINPSPAEGDSRSGNAGMNANTPAVGGAVKGEGLARPDGNAGQNGARTPEGTSGSALKVPSKCIYAIVGCCKVGSLRVDEECFSRFDCNGPFWGQSPCRRESASMAFQVVSKYMAAKEKEKREEEAQEMGVTVEQGANHQEEEESSPFDPIGPLPSRG